MCLGQRNLQPLVLLAKFDYFVIGGVAGCLAGESVLAGLQELLGPFVVLRWRDFFAAAEVGDGYLAANAFDDDADFLLKNRQPKTSGVCSLECH